MHIGLILPPPSPPAGGRQSSEQQKHGGNAGPGAGPGERRRWQGGRQRHIGDALLIQPDHVADPAIGVDHGADPGIGDADHRQAFLDGAELGRRQMLIGPGRQSKPAIIGQIEQPFGPLGRVRHLPGKNNFVAD